MYKKYQKAVSVSLVASMLTLSACSTQGVIDGIDVMLGKKEVVSQTNEQALTPVVVQDASQTLTINENFSHGGYYYDKLSDVQKSIYIALYDTFVSYGKECHLGDNDAEQIAIVYKSIVFDHPEIFYIDGFQLEYFKSEIPYYIFKPNYTKTPDEIELTKDKIDVYVNTALCAINNNGDEYAILQQIYEYIITTTRYDMSAPDLSSIVSVMCNGRAVCEGYAKTTMYLLQQYGIQCTVVPGYIRKNGTAHLWNAAKINGQWYYIDTTWGDEDFENDRNAPEVRYDYLCVSEEYLAGSHQIDAFVDMPKCVSMDDNYYKKSGKMVTSETDTNLAKLLKHLETDKTASFACSDAGTYQKVIDKLINRKGIFAYLNNKRVNLKYVVNSHVYSITFWIKEE